MSSAATFTLICNDGKCDRMIMATKLLNQRIKDVMCARKRAGKADISPTLVDLERTHVLFINSHFRPFAAIGFEYNKVRPQSGNPYLGGGVTFSIPQFGDFFHDMVCRVRLSQFTADAGVTPAQGSALFPSDNPTDDPVGDVPAFTFHNIVDACGNVLVAGSGGLTPSVVTVAYRNFVRYCEYPGNRLFKLVKFDVNGNPLDQYDNMVPTMLEKFCTPPHKRTGYDRLTGQEVPLTGYTGLCCAVVTDADAANTPQGITRSSNTQSNQTVALFGEAPLTLGGAPTVVNQTSITTLNNPVTPTQIDVSRQLIQIVNGPQTPKPVAAPLEIWNKLRFWFNDDVRLSIASVSIPFGQRFITVELEQAANLVFEFPSIYLETITDAGAGTTRVKTYSPIFQLNGISTPPQIDKMEMYINNIFVNPEIHDIYIKRIGFTLIRVYRQHTQRCNQESSDEKLLSQLKWPIEYMMIGLRPVWNIKHVVPGNGGTVTGNQNEWRDWHRLTRMVDATCDEPMLAEIANGGIAPAGGSSIGQVMPDQYWLPVPTVDSMTLTAHGIVLYDGFTDMMYNAYLPYHYGGTSLVTPDDPGALFINMSLFPRTYQPSGHLNISRARETYLKWTTSYVSSKTPADLFVVGIAINFLLITDGSAVLRYST